MNRSGVNVSDCCPYTPSCVQLLGQSRRCGENQYSRRVTPSTYGRLRMPRVRTCLLATIGVALALGIGASASGGSDPKAMTLQLNDMPVGFGLDNGYYAGNARAAKESTSVSV